jgi:hypothetical protein
MVLSNDSPQERRKRANFSDMQRRGTKISQIIDEVRGNKDEITDEDMKEIRKRIAPHVKHFTEYDW